WTFGNNADKAAWQAQLDEDVAAADERAHLAADAEAQRKEAEQLDAEQAQKDDMKKNRGKYVHPPLMDKGLYVELHYYTDRGLDEARAAVGVADNEAMTMRQNDDGTTSWIPAGSARDAKSIVEDKDLRWEQLLEAVPRAIVAMERARWDPARVEMLARFWGNLQLHPFKLTRDPCDKRALIVYQ
ncbi:hypothetical protein B0H21DRAFT_675289, partial [Amylocystis lapponica]